ncbi:MAG: N-acetylmuramoyl-L-alanine amidase, partial [Evtepia sp.]
MKQVCFDPGHGPGSPNKSPDRTYEEQEFALDLSKRIKSILLQHGVQVTMTRDATGYPGLTERCQIANKIKDL